MSCHNNKDRAVLTDPESQYEKYVLPTEYPRDSSSTPQLSEDSTISFSQIKDETKSDVDTGAAAWLVLLGAWCSSFCSYGWINSSSFPLFTTTPGDQI